MQYLVTSPGERTITVEAQNSTQAKRQACRYWGINPSDKWCGISAMMARKIDEKGSINGAENSSKKGLRN